MKNVTKKSMGQGILRPIHQYSCILVEVRGKGSTKLPSPPQFEMMNNSLRIATVLLHADEGDLPLCSCEHTSYIFHSNADVLGFRTKVKRSNSQYLINHTTYKDLRKQIVLNFTSLRRPV